MPPIKDFKDDAGARSNLTTMNVMSIVADRFVHVNISQTNNTEGFNVIGGTRGRVRGGGES